MIKREKICLLVEDDPEDQELFIDALHHASETTGCYVVSNGEEALFALQHADFIPDYIFTDLNMPRMDGMEFLRTLRSMERFRHVPVIVLSSDFSDALIQRAKNLGVTACYSKTRIDVLRDILERYFPDRSRQQTIL